jgi:hypothetical protein
MPRYKELRDAAQRDIVQKAAHEFTGYGCGNRMNRSIGTVYDVLANHLDLARDVVDFRLDTLDRRDAALAQLEQLVEEAHHD